MARGQSFEDAGQLKRKKYPDGGISDQPISFSA